MHIDLPTLMPVMPLPGAMLFPNTLLPLYIFEPRYRAMLAHSLETDRTFSVALLKPGVEETASSDDFFHVAGAGLIRACVGRADGTSHLILQGLARVRFTSFPQTAPFFIANIEPVDSFDGDSTEREALGSRLLDLCSELKKGGVEFPKQLEKYMEESPDTEVLADVIASNFVADPLRKQHLLEQQHLNQRLKLLIRYLREEVAPG